jgi:16S rRNA (guanine1516-N2)-methyltransferase
LLPLPLENHFDYYLGMQQDILYLSPVDKARGGALYVDFASDAAEYRRTTSGIKQDIAKAVGCKPGYRPCVLDLTAGLGGDAFVLASVGCDVTLVENNAVAYALLEDGFRRASELANDVAEVLACMHLQPQQDALAYLSTMPARPDVIYLDPMFPERQKAAKVKKAMQYFHDVVGCAHEQELALLEQSLQSAEKRVVVKRPRKAPLLASKPASYQLIGKSVRYDIYLC